MLLGELPALISAATATVARSTADFAARPIIRLELDPAERALISEIHDASDWVFTIDRNMGIEFFDHGGRQGRRDRPDYLIDYTPPMVTGHGHRLIINSRSLAELEAILHPLVRAGERHFLATSQRRGCRLAVLDMPLLFETGGETRCDATLVVSAPGFVQRARVLGRARMTEERLAAILARQTPDAEKRRRADFVIRTGLDRRVSRMAARRIAARLAAERGRRWPACWAGALMAAQGGDHA